ncbi:hypothetical protein R3Q08_07595 [Rhodococcus erythropolis]|uniref:hypothetical protein n=1 Tax=Rhodococcus erythropolis TaxID=1833 RepID=UPI002949DC7A|nr:hypothetical protein [Rhodococcus erythropolis]MDV6208094.1 hypothetical protein [Rhodococcus erythropolis]
MAVWTTLSRWVGDVGPLAPYEGALSPQAHAVAEASAIASLRECVAWLGIGWDQFLDAQELGDELQGNPLVGAVFDSLAACGAERGFKREGVVPGLSTAQEILDRYGMTRAIDPLR